MNIKDSLQNNVVLAKDRTVNFLQTSVVPQHSLSGQDVVLSILWHKPDWNLQKAGDVLPLPEDEPNTRGWETALCSAWQQEHS